MRGCFGCGPGRMQLGFDFASLEARIQGHFVIPYTDGIALAESLIAEKPNDCFDIDTQILTKDGWKYYDDITLDTEIANWINPNTSSGVRYISYSKPTNIVSKNTRQHMIHILTDRIDQLVTPGHRVVLFNRNTKEYIVVLAEELKDYLNNNKEFQFFIPANGYSTDTSNKLLESLTADDYQKIVCIEKDCGMVFQSESLECIEKLVLHQRLLGSSSLIIEKTKNSSTVYQTTIGKAPLNSDGFLITGNDIKTVNDETEVWCVEVPSTFVIIRRNNKITVTGNCHNINANKLGITRDNAKSFSYA